MTPSNSYPMTVIKRSGRAESKSGGKDYHLLIITSNTSGATIYIERFGRARQWGHGWKLRKFPNSNEAMDLFNKKCREKFDREYGETLNDSTTQVADFAELKKSIGLQYTAKIGKSLLHIDPNADVSDLKDAEPDTEFDDDGRVKPRARRTLEPTPEPVEDRVATNPNWGTWG